jgi:Gpi18-like mannosyltransferase
MRLAAWILMMCLATAVPTAVVLAKWNPSNSLQLVAVMLYSFAMPIGGFWMIYRSLRDEEHPFFYVVLALMHRLFGTTSNESETGMKATDETHSQTP